MALRFLCGTALSLCLVAAADAQPAPTPATAPPSPTPSPAQLPPPPKLERDAGNPEPKTEKKAANDPKKDEKKPAAAKNTNPPKDGFDLKRFPEKFRQQFQALTEEDRARFLANWQRWKSMGEKERIELMKRAVNDRVKTKQTIDDALRKLDLTLDKDRREVFELRYRQERRKIEEKLKADQERQRADMIAAMLDKLKREFSPQPEAAPPPAAPAPGTL